MAGYGIRSKDVLNALQRRELCVSLRHRTHVVEETFKFNPFKLYHTQSSALLTPRVQAVLRTSSCNTRHLNVCAADLLSTGSSKNIVLQHEAFKCMRC